MNLKLESPVLALEAGQDPEDAVAISVRDRGQGIAPENLPKLFDSFFTTKGRHGTGLGLAVTWGIVASHQGLIEVDSRPGAGARFQVFLPMAAGPALPNHAQRSPTVEVSP